MNLSTHRFWLLGLLSLLTAGAFAQQAAPMTLDDCIRLGLKQNYQVQQAEFDVQRSKQFVREQLASAYPQASFSAQLTDNIRIAKFPFPGEFLGQPGTFVPIEFGVRYNVNTGLQVTQIIYSQSLFTGIEAARQSIALSELNVQRTREQTAYDIAALYYSAQVNRVQIGLLETSLRQVQDLMQVTELTVQTGTGMQIDFNRLKVNETNLLTQRQSLMQAYDQQLALLKLQLGLAPEAPFAIRDSIELDTWRIEGMTPNPQASTDIQLLEKQVEMNEYAFKLARQAYVPTLAAFGSASLQAQSSTWDFVSNSDRWFNAAAIGLQLSVPVFDGFRTDARIRQAEVDLLKSQNEVRNVEQAYETQFYNARQKLAAAEAALKAQQANIQLADEVYSYSSLRFRQGVAPVTEVLTAETSRKEAQTGYLTALVQYQLARLEWIRFSGNLAELTKL
ncbi:MAG: TolC family protein [Bacteroidia bacterium]|nr:TolC family protein [Bacteroidia bacterium]